MKTKYKKNQTQFNVRVNEEEFKVIQELKDNYAINLSGAFKIFLKDLLEKIKNGKVL
jgi:hypothetical protein